MNTSRYILRKMAPFMKSRGFKLSKKGYYYILNDVAYCLAVDSGDLLYATAYVMPLYIPCEVRYYTYGSRSNEWPEVPLQPICRNSTLDEIDAWCDSLCCCIEEIILPFFKHIETPKTLIHYAEHNHDCHLGMFRCPKVFCQRLVMYSYLYWGNYYEATIAMNQYRNQLIKSTFLTDHCRQTYLDEINTLQEMLSNKRNSLCAFFESIKENTKKILDT